MPNAADTLRVIKNFDDLRTYLEEELDWPLEGYELEDLTFEYSPAELGLKDEDAAKVRAIRQLRPVVHEQPWGIFFVEFEKKRMPVVVLRRILSHLVVKKRASANPATAKAWNLDDLLFISAFGGNKLAGPQAGDGLDGPGAGEHEIAFAHFHQEAGDLPTLKVLGWDGADTGLKLDYVDSVLRERLCWPEDPEDVAAWRDNWSKAFRHKLGHVIRTSDALAERLAVLARRIRYAAVTLMNHESERGALRQLHKAFQTALIHDLTEDQFADTYAQTVTYGLLTAAISSTDMTAGRYGTAVHAGKLADMVPITNPFLKEMLGTFLQAGGQKGGINFDELGIQEVVDLLRGDETDLPAILRDFGNKTQGEDPVIFFYEHFLSAYDRQLKVQRGSFYTPRPVVSYIVRSVHELLQSEFGLEDGLASTVSWGEMAKRMPGLKIPEGTKVDSAFVVILDPATGTGTFLVEVIELIHGTLMTKWKAQGLGATQRENRWNEYVPQHLLPRLHGYELMMAPYAIAHMKIGLKLWETGYQFGSIERVRVYLTNSLEPPAENGGQLAFAGWTPALAHEAQAVNAIKRWQRFTVVVGNPPYAGVSSNLSPEIRKTIDPYRYVDGVPIEEKSALQFEKNLNDDYVKFVRFSESLLEASVGVLGFITNNGYLETATLRGMRNHLLRTFGRRWILDLHGDSDKREVDETGAPDVNVFEIKKGVAISLLLRDGREHDLSVLRHDLRGPVGAKNDWLAIHSAKSTPFTRFTTLAPSYFFFPVDAVLHREYSTGLSVRDMFRVNSTGFESGRDEILTDFTREELLAKIRYFATAPERDVRARFSVQEAWGKHLLERRATMLEQGYERRAIRFLFGPFDIRWCFFRKDLLKTNSYSAGRHLVTGPNAALLVMRQVSVEGPYTHVGISSIIPNNRSFYSTKGKVSYFPMWLYSDESDLVNQSNVQLGSNLGLGVLAQLQEKLTPESSITEEEILHFAYAVLHSPSFRLRYDSFLRTDFPRIPLTSSLNLFRALATLGGELVALHLMQSPVLDGEKDELSTYSGPTAPVVEKIAYDDETIYLDKAGRASFCCISEAVWNFHIGGYQVCEKWLKDRKGRRLSAEDIDHYQRIIVALQHTLRIMDEIDEVIEEHGGWPIK